jgi:hypothetical protein
VSRASRLSLAIALLLGLTLAPKLLSAGRLAEPDGARLARDMAGMLAERGFQTRIVPHHLFPYVLARRGGCTLVAANAPANGSLRDRFADAAARVGPTFYHYRSPPIGPFPRFRPVVEEYLQHWAYRLGLVVPRRPVIAIAAAPACRPDRLGWPALRVWPRPIPLGPPRQSPS